jgi:succinate dehydrogenase/fumarate reductase flavoprotein subunit
MEKYDLIVVGGGISGVSASVAAAVCKKDGVNAHTVDVQKVRKALLEVGAAL